MSFTLMFQLAVFSPMILSCNTLFGTNIYGITPIPKEKRKCNIKAMIKPCHIAAELSQTSW